MKPKPNPTDPTDPELAARDAEIAAEAMFDRAWFRAFLWVLAAWDTVSFHARGHCATVRFHFSRRCRRIVNQPVHTLADEWPAATVLPPDAVGAAPGKIDQI